MTGDDFPTRSQGKTLPVSAAIHSYRDWSLRVRVCVILFGSAASLILLPSLFAADVEPDLKTLAQAYQPNIVPLLKTYCNKCHAGEEAEAEIDLAAFATMADVRRHQGFG